MVAEFKSMRQAREADQATQSHPDAMGITMDVAEGGFPDTNADDEWRRAANRWELTLHYDGRDLRIPFWQGSGHQIELPTRGRMTDVYGWTIKYRTVARGGDVYQYPKAPTLLSVLECLASEVNLGDQLFEDFCADLGYDTDSRKAYKSWEESRDLMLRIRDWLGHEQFEKFRYTDWGEIECSSD